MPEIKYLVQYSVYNTTKRYLAGIGYIFSTKEEAESYKQYLEETREWMAVAAEHEKAAGYPGGNEKSYAYAKDWQGSEWVVVTREVTQWQEIP